MMKRHPGAVGLVAGLLIGILAGTGEVINVAWFVRGGTFRPNLLLDAWLIDGGLLAVLGLLVGFALTPFVRRQTYQVSPAPARQISPRRASSGRSSRRAVLGVMATAVAAAGVGGLSRLVEAASETPPRQRVALVSAAGGGAPAGASAAGAPNVVLITIDTLRADQLGSYGHPYIKTPALDSFAAQGARFNLHLIQEPQTNPSHCSMFTGMYPSSSGVRIHMVDKLPDTLDTLATVYKRAGYRTAGLYSWMSFEPQYSNFQRGFDVYQDLTLDKPGLLGNPVIQQAAANYRVAEQYLAVPQAASQVVGLNAKVEAQSKGRADRTTDAAIEQLHAFGQQPFFMWLHYFDPHYPYAPPSGYADLYDPGYRGSLTGDIATVDAILAGTLHPAGADLQRLISLYQGEISYVDSQIARLFSTLDQLGLTGNTIVAITGDHGESFAEHAVFEENGNIFHPKSLYNAEAQVPLLMRYPPAIKPGIKVNQPTQAIDLFPTLLELSGQPVPAQSQGTSMRDLLSGAPVVAPRQAFAAMPDYVFTAIATPRWKLIQNNASGQRRLYDLASDLAETHDVLAANQETAGELANSLATWMKAVKIS